MAYLIRVYAPIGTTVLDPFCGFGSMGVACQVMKREFTGVELNRTRAEIAQNACDEIGGVIAG